MKKTIEIEMPDGYEIVEITSMEAGREFDSL